MATTLADFLTALDDYSERIPLTELVQRLQALRITREDVAAVAQFGHTTYQRNLMHAGPAYHALVLCWRAGQRSPIHDHNGSSCGVRIIEGVATETFFSATPDGHIYATGSRTLPAGSVCGSQDADMHQMSNLQAENHDLITLHIYSPPLLRMGMYSLTDDHRRDFIDPIVGLLQGAGI